MNRLDWNAINKYSVIYFVQLKPNNNITNITQQNELHNVARTCCVHSCDMFHVVTITRMGTTASTAKTTS